MIVNRTFNGTEKLEEILIKLLTYEIDKLNRDSYDEDGANAIPLKGVANK